MNIDFWLFISLCIFFGLLRLKKGGGTKGIHNTNLIDLIGKPSDPNPITINVITTPTSTTLPNHLSSSSIPPPAAIAVNPKAVYEPATYTYSQSENKVKFADGIWWDFVRYPVKSFLNYENTEILSRYKKIQICKVSPSPPTESSATLSSPSSSFSSPSSSSSSSCEFSHGDSLLRKWRANEEDYYCPNSPSKVTCHDSGSQFRFCIFDNSMINMKRMREVKEKSGGGGGGGGKVGHIGGGHNVIRRFERGFLSADCGEFGLTNLSYFSLYHPTIDAGGDAPCDYVFNETVILYSHSHIYNLPAMLNDLLNVVTITTSLNIAKSAKDITILNIDGLRKGGKVFNDRTSQFFSLYKSLFRRVVSLSQFEASTNICFKRLILPTFPVVPFVVSSSPQAVPSISLSTACPTQFVSSIFQRFNIINRLAHNVLESSLELDRSRSLQIVLLKRSTAANKSVAMGGGDINNNLKSINIAASRPYFDDSLDLDVKIMTQKLNAKENVENWKNNLGRGFLVEIKIVDVSNVLYPDQIRMLATSSLIIGLESTNLLTAVNMPIGTERCCGVLELQPSIKLLNSNSLIANASEARLAGIGLKTNSNNNNNEAVLTQFGLHYRRLAIYSDSFAYTLPIYEVVKKVEEMIDLMTGSPTCLSEAIIRNPFEVL